ncbi:Abi-alpha family protein [Pantoea septica]|uniref:Abi-alpha family protein n=1 Tax=Pantoea septica TaxID=472695 RepID=UPI0023F21A9C|nr:Abi-alpha family protein [Pantoea septica]
MDKETLDLIQSIPKDVWLQLYNDTPRPMLRQFGKLGEDLAKTLRLVTFPIQCTAYVQDRIDRGFKAALEKVPKERRVSPPDGLVLDIADKLKHHDSETLVGQLYVELLSASMDSERNNQAHPGFLHVIGQLSSDEALFLLRLSENKPSLYIKKLFSWGQVSKIERESYLEGLVFSFYGIERKLTELTLNPEDYFYPENFYIYIEHLKDLGLLEYTNEATADKWDQWRRLSREPYDIWCIQLTKYGELFFNCCSAALGSLDN